MAISPPLVLVVDDDPDTRELCVLTLGMAGFRTEAAENGRAALDKATELRPDAILLDLMLPGMDGWEVCRQLKSDVSTKRIPIVAVTGHALVSTLESAQTVGCEAVITKPYLPEALIAEVRRVLDRAGRLAEAY